MKHINLFKNKNEYDVRETNGKLAIPNVSLCKEENILLFNSKNTVKRIAYFNVTEDSLSYWAQIGFQEVPLLLNIGGIKSLKLDGEYLDLNYETYENKTFTFEDILNEMTFQNEIFNQIKDSLGNDAYYMNTPLSMSSDIYAYPNNRYIFDNTFKIEDYAVAIVGISNNEVKQIWCEPLEFYNPNVFNIEKNVITFAPGFKSVLYDNHNSSFLSAYGLDNVSYGILFYKIENPLDTNYVCEAQIIHGTNGLSEEVSYTQNELFNLLKFDGEPYTYRTEDIDGVETTFRTLNTPINVPSELILDDTSYDFNGTHEFNINEWVAVMAFPLNGINDLSWQLSMTELLDTFNGVFIFENNVLKSNDIFLDVIKTANLSIFFYNTVNFDATYTVKVNKTISNSYVATNILGEHELEFEFTSDIVPYWMFSISEHLFKYYSIFTPLVKFNDDFFVGMKTIPFLPSYTNSNFVFTPQLDTTQFEGISLIRERASSDQTFDSIDAFAPIGVDYHNMVNLFTPSSQYVIDFNGYFYRDFINICDNDKSTKILFRQLDKNNPHEYSRDLFGYNALESVIMPNYDTFIDSFDNCINLTSITLSETTTSFYSGTYGDWGYLPNVSQVIIKAKTAPSTKPWIILHTNSNPFNYFAENGTLYYPKGSDYSSWIAELPSGWTYEEVDFDA